MERKQLYFLRLTAILAILFYGVNQKTFAQQEGEISITVTDSIGLSAIPGVNVTVKGTNRGASTNADGKLKLKASAGETLVFSFIGYIKKEVLVGNRSTIDVILSPSLEALNEVVVVGYGTQKKANLTGATSTINFDSKELMSRPLVNVSTALTGLAPGIYVNQASGNPQNNSATITVRGTGSLNQGSGPLIIIDGQPGDMDIVNPNDIASVSILKDASSAAIYGSRAANGVILITTKSGSNTKGKITFEYNGYVGRTAPTKLFELVTDVGDHMTLINRIQRNSGVVESFSQDRINEWRTKSKTDPILYPNTNWYDVIIKPNVLTGNTFSARGGNEKVDFYTSLGILTNNGVVLNSGVTKYNFRNKINYKINDWLKFGNIITGNFSKRPPDLTNNLFIVYPNPSVLPQSPDGRYGVAMSGGIDLQAGNLLAEINEARGKTDVQNYTGKLFAILTPLPGLDITASYFLDAANSDSWSSSYPTNRWNFQTNTQISGGSGSGSGISNSFSKTKRRVLDFFANYNKSFGKHNLRLLAGFNQEKWDNSYFSASKLGLISNDLPVLDAASFQPAANGNGSDYRMRSFFGRAGYDFDDKYLFEANVRYDGSSRFSPENRWGFFPSFSAGWVISKEKFWDGLTRTVDYFKLRASWGRLGNNGIGNYEWQNVYQASNYSFSDKIVQGLSPTSLKNRNISWETTDAFNIGADFQLFRKFNVSVDYYDKYTHGILSQLPIPSVNGTLDPPFVNSAKVRNRGLEFDIKYNTKIGDLGIGLGALAAFNRNKIEKYKGAIIENHGVNVESWTEGRPIGIFYVMEVDHIIQDQSEVDQLIAKGYTFSDATPGPGDFLFKDTNGDKNIGDEDMVLKGNPIPLYTYAFNVNLNYKGFDIYALSNGVGKVDKYLKGYSEGLSAMVGGYGYPARWMDSWTEENRSTTIPKIYLNDSRNNGDNDYFMSPGAYFRVKTIQLGYSLPKTVINKLKLTKARVYVNLENYFQFTKYRGMDPEANNSADANRGAGSGAGSNPNETNTYPLFKTASIGINLGF